jgi:hypothetical protein
LGNSYGVEDSSHVAQEKGPMVDYCEHRNIISGSIRKQGFLVKLSTGTLEKFKKNLGFKTAHGHWKSFKNFRSLKQPF